jgi:hypothetical protein
MKESYEGTTMIFVAILGKFCGFLNRKKSWRYL